MTEYDNLITIVCSIAASMDSLVNFEGKSGVALGNGSAIACQQDFADVGESSIVPIGVFDTAGQEDFIALRTAWMRDRDGLVLVSSIVHGESFEGLKSFYDQICDVYEDGILPPIILVQNKADLDNPKAIHGNARMPGKTLTFAHRKKAPFPMVVFMLSSLMTPTAAMTICVDLDIFANPLIAIPSICVVFVLGVIFVLGSRSLVELIRSTCDDTTNDNNAIIPATPAAPQVTLSQPEPVMPPAVVTDYSMSSYEVFEVPEEAIATVGEDSSEEKKESHSHEATDSVIEGGGAEPCEDPLQFQYDPSTVELASQWQLDLELDSFADDILHFTEKRKKKYVEFN